MPSTGKRRIMIEMHQASTDQFELEVPDNMTDEQALERFQEDQLWVSEDHHNSEVTGQEFWVLPGNPNAKYPIIFEEDIDED